MQSGPEFAERVAEWRQRRRWRHLIALGLGGLALVSGALEIGIVITGYNGGSSATATDSGIPLPLGIALYLSGAGLFAWGGAKGFTRALPKWGVLSIVFGFLLALVMLAVAAGGSGNGGGDGSSGSASDQGPRRKPKQVTGLAAWSMDRSAVERLVGAPATGPHGGSNVMRARSFATWRGPETDGTRPPTLSITIRCWAKDGARSPSKKVREVAVPVPSLGDGGFVAHHSRPQGEFTAARGAVKDWVVSASLRSHEHSPDKGPLLITEVARIRDALAAAEAS